MYKGEADWTLIGEVKNNPKINIPVFGNGDMKNVEKVKEVRDKYGVDGVMIGRASIGNPWFFNEVKHFLNTGEHLPAPTIEDRVAACRSHLEKSVDWKGERLGILEMRRHYSNYFKGIPNSKEYRMILVTSDILEELHSTLDDIRANIELLEVA